MLSVDSSKGINYVSTEVGIDILGEELAVIGSVLGPVRVVTDMHVTTDAKTATEGEQ